MSQPLSEAGGSFGRVSLMDIDRPVASHAHPQCHALFKVGGADSVFEIGGHRYPLVDGSGVLVNAWQPHSYPFPPAPPGHAQILALYIEPRWLAQFDASFAAAARRDFFTASCITVPRSTAALVHALAEELRGERMERNRACALLETLMVELSLRFSAHRQFPVWARTAAGSVADRRIRKAMSLLSEQATASIDMEDLARAVALSRPHFFDLFRRSLGITPQTFRNVVRMESAYRALHTGAPIGELAKALGFSAHSHFTRFFRENHGISPDAYRRAAWQLENNAWR